MEAGDHALAAERAREALATDLQTFLPDAEGGVGGRAAARARDDPPARAGDARPRRGCARAGASSARPSRPRGPRSPPRRSASPRTGC